VSSVRVNRLLLAWMPAFRLERCGWGATEPVALVQRNNGALIVLSTTPAAARGGVTIGMNSTEARALLPTLHLEHMESSTSELVDLTSLSRCFEKLGPTYRAFGHDSVAVEICAGAFGGENACVEIAVDILRKMGHLSVVVVVDGDRCDADSAALGLAMWKSRHAVVPHEQLSGALSEIPLEILAPLLLPTSSLPKRLHTMGVTTAGELSRLHTASVARRFGEEGVRLLKMIRAEISPSPPLPDRPPNLPFLRREIDGRVTTTPALRPHITELVNRLISRLRANESAASRVQLTFKLDSTADSVMTIRTQRPWRQAGTILRLIDRRLEQWPLNGEVTALELRVLKEVRWYGSQPLLLKGDDEPQEPIEELVIRLEDTLGETKIFRPASAPSHRPETAWGDRRSVERDQTDHSIRRPSILLPRPTTIEVEFNRGPRHVELEGRWCEVTGRMGPERIAGEWWSDSQYARDYWQLELTDGRRPWVFHDRKRDEWRLHGWFE
jgi:protein ImuB